MKSALKSICIVLCLGSLSLSSCIKEIVPTITTLPVTNISGTSAVCGGTITNEGSGPVIDRGVCWSKDLSPDIADNKTSDGEGPGSFISEISGLDPDTEYYVRAYATNTAGTSYGNEIMFTASTHSKNQIIADHNIVADFDKIPAKYMTEVKKMMVCFLGESHSESYRIGLELLEEDYPEYTCNVSTGEAYTDQYLRANKGSSTGEATWFTWYAYPLESRPAASNSIKNIIKEYSDNGNPIDALGYGWCWDMAGNGTVSLPDQSFGCHWFGYSKGGPDGDRCWGLDFSDYLLTGNSVSMDTYLYATEDYISYCKANGYKTKVIFTTGPVANLKEESYQVYLKHEYIRDFVKADTTRILFDYADILCYDDDGKLTTSVWEGHVYPSLTIKNAGDWNIGHIGSEGAIRLAKAQWWMLARIAGWDGNY